jgi:hypothetical protein
MRLGCFGCLALIVVVLVIGVGALGIVFLSGNITNPPEVNVTRYTRSDGHAAQQKLFELVLRQTGRSSRQDPVVITEQEANAFLANHLVTSAEIAFEPLIVRFVKGQLEVQGQTPLRNLLQGPPIAQMLPYVRDSRLDRPIWVTVKGRIVVEGKGSDGSRNYGRVDLSEFALGQQELGTWLLNLMLGPTGKRLLRWQVPSIVKEIQIQDGRAVVVTR